MKKQLLFAAGIAFCSATAVMAQQPVIPCWTTEAQQALFTADPALKQKFELEQSMFDLQYQQNLQAQNNPQQKVATPVYTVPVVFHILHLNGPENISDQVCIDALAQVNKDYRKLGSDIANINPTFASLYVDAEINFMLAHKDPNGNCTTGIVHHYDAKTNWDQSKDFSNCTGQHPYTWDHTKYLNIYIVKQIIPQGGSSGSGIIVGYTYNPGGSGCSASDVIVYNYQFLAGLQARSLSHEIGHWFNLIHTFGSTNNPGVSCGSTSGGDGVGDTPDTKGYFSTCPGGNTGPFTGCSASENIENFMDYSSCPRMFTQGQVTRMRTAIQSSNQLRNNLWTAANLGSSGTDVYSTSTCAPIADFYSNKTQICAGQSITFNDASYNGTVTSRSWTFQGGSPGTSSASAPTVTFNTAGTYSVSFTASNGNGSNSITKTSYVTVVPGYPTQTAPFSEGFESGLPSDWSVVNNNAGSVTWALAGVGANGSSKSMYMNSAAGNPAGHIDILESPVFDYRYVTGVSLSYYYAYARKTSSQADTFKIQYSLDCGGTWSNVLGSTDAIATMASNSGGTTSSAFIPSSSQWHQKTVNSSLMSALNNKPNVKFRFYFRNDVAVSNANNLYLDNINLSGTVGINELENEIGLSIYPNPTNGTATVEFTLSDEASASVSVTDLLGRTMETSGKLPYENGAIKYTVNKANNLGTGIYLVNIDVNGRRVTKKLVIQ